MKTPNLELGGGLESGDGGDYVIGIEELEEQVPAKGRRAHCGRPHEARSSKLAVKNRKKIKRRSTPYFSSLRPEQIFVF